MIYKTFYIALLHIKVVFSNRSVLIFSLLMPILFTAFMRQANLSKFGRQGAERWKLNVVNEDASPLSRQLVADLSENPDWKVELLSDSTAASRVKQSDAVATLHIPRGFADKVMNGQSVSLDLATNPVVAKKAQLVEQWVRLQMVKLIAPIEAARASVSTAEQRGLFNHPDANGQDQRKSYFVESLTHARNRMPSAPAGPMSVKPLAENSATADEKAEGADQSSPGMVVMFALLFMVSGTNIIIFERQTGTLRRLLVMPMSKANILAGKILGIFSIGVVQMCLLIAAGALLFGVRWGQSPLALVLMILSFALVSTSMGILLSTLVRTIAQADAMASMVVMTISALGGAWWSLDSVPHWMKLLGHAMPTAWAMDGFHDIIIRKASTRMVLPEIFVLLLFGTIFLIISLKRFRYEQ